MSHSSLPLSVSRKTAISLPAYSGKDSSLISSIHFCPSTERKGTDRLPAPPAAQEKVELGLTDTLSSPVDSVPQLEHSGVRRRASCTSSVGPTGTHSSDPCSAGTALQHDIWQRHHVPLQSTQSALPSSPSFGFQEPSCSLKCFVSAASFPSAGVAKTSTPPQNPLSCRLSSSS